MGSVLTTIRKSNVMRVQNMENVVTYSVPSTISQNIHN
jgi:hypothetical protein